MYPLYLYVFCIFDFVKSHVELMEHVSESAVEILVMLVVVSPIMALFLHLLSKLSQLGV